MPSTVLLDYSGLEPHPAGALEITTEVEFLRHSLDDGMVIVRGARLCRWAEVFYKGRRIETRPFISLANELGILLPDLSKDSIQSIVKKYGVRLETANRPLTVLNILTSIYPCSHWEDTPSLEHFANFLDWIVTESPDSAVTPIIEIWAEKCAIIASGSYASLYTRCTTQADAEQILLNWLGYDSEQPALPTYPLNIPIEVEKKLASKWRANIIETQGNFFVDLLKKELPSQLVRKAAQITLSYFWEHRTQLLTSSLGDILRPYLSIPDQRRLTSILPPPCPQAFPDTDWQIINWYKSEYLPFRRWQSLYGDGDDRARVNDLAAKFIHWYLETYPKMLMGSSLLEEVSFRRASKLVHDETPFVTLLLVLDGLGVVDAQQLTENIRNEISRLSVLDEGACFCSLPTITEFCKPALLSGQTPSVSQNSEYVGKLISEGFFPVSDIESTQVGKVLIWYVGEPDRTYHKNVDPVLIRTDVETELRGAVAKIQQLVNQVSAHVPLRIIITADHGRLLGPSIRSHKIPDGMQAHGRAAWGPNNRTYQGNGYEIEGGIAYLSKESFGLIEDAVVAVDENAFVTSDGRTGTEWYTHGGVYPEEAIVPWIEMVRDYLLPEIKITITGTGVVGGEAAIELVAMNPSEETIVLDQLELRFEGSEPKHIHFEIKSNPLDESRYSIPINHWPTIKQAATATGKVRGRLQKGVIFTIECQVNITSIEMSSSENILEDLF